MKRPRNQVSKVKLFRSLVGLDKEYYPDVFPKEGPSIEDIQHVVSRSAVTTNVAIPNQVSDDPREVALKNASV